MERERDDDDEGMGGKFWFALIGGGLAVVAAGLVLFIVFGRVWYTYGFFATFLLLAIVLIVVAWVFDKRQAAKRRRYAE